MKLGIGYLFGGKDDGIIDMLKSIRSGILDVAGESDAANKSGARMGATSKKSLSDIGSGADHAKSMVGLLGTAFQALTQIQLSGIRGSLDEITAGLDGVTSGGMTTKIEGMFTDFDKGFRASAVRAGYLGKDLKELEGQVFSTSYGMNRSSEELGGNVLAMTKAGLTFEKLLGKGSTMADFQKVVEATGISATEYTDSFNELSKSWGLGDDGAREFLDTLSEQATALGTADQSFKALPRAIKSMNKEWAVTLKTMGPDAVKSALLGTDMLGTMISRVTGTNVDEGMAAAGDAFAMLSQSGAGFTKMLIGLGGELTPLTEEFAFAGIGSGGIGGSLDELAKGAKDPAKFMADLSAIIAELDKTGGSAAMTVKKRLLSSIADVNPSLSFLAMNGSAVGDALTEMNGLVAAGGIGLNELGKQAYTSGLHLDDTLSRARDGLENTFGKAFLPERQKIVGLLEGAYKGLGTVIKNLTGTSDKSNKGWRDQLALLGISADMADKIKEVFGSLRKRLNDWFDKAGPLAAFGVAVKYIAGMMGGLLLAMAPLITVGLTIASVVGTLLVSALGAVASAITAGTLVIGLKIAAGAVAAVAYAAAYAAAVVGTLVVAGTFLYLLFSGKLPDAITTASNALQDGFVVAADWGSKQLQKLTGWLMNIDGAQLANDAEKFVTDLWDTIVNAFNSDVSLRDDTKSAGARLMESVFAVGAQVYRIVGQFATRVWEIAKERFAAIEWKDVAKSVWGGIRDAFMDTVATVGSLYDAALAWVSGVNWANIGSSLGSGIAELSADLYDRLMKAFDGMSKYISGKDWTKVGHDLVMKLVDSVSAAFGQGRIYDTAGKNVMAGVADAADAASSDPGIMTIIASGLGTLFDKAISAAFTKEFWSQIWNASLKAAVLVLKADQALGDVIEGAFTALGKAAVDAMFGAGTWDDPMATVVAQMTLRVDQMKAVFKSLWADIRAGAYDLFGNSINSFVSHDFGVIDAIVDTAKGWFTSLSDVASSMFDGILSKISEFLKRFQPIGELFSKLADKFGLSAPDVQAVIDLNAKSDANKPVRTLVEQSGDTALIRAIIDQHNQDRVWLEKIHDKLRAAAPVAGSPGRSSGHGPVQALVKG